jgi:hypothetical protein
MTHAKSVRRITSDGLTLVKIILPLSDKLVLLPLDSSLTQRQRVRPYRKTKHQKTNALANRRQTHSI